MNFTAFDYSFWAADFAFSAIALFLFFTRHRIAWPLWALLAWRSFGDAMEFAARHDWHLYARVYYRVTAVELLIEILLAVILCGELVRERRRTAGIFGAGIALIAAAAFLIRNHGPLNAPVVISTEAVAVGVVGALLALGWIGRMAITPKELPEPWRGILFGAIALIFVQSLSFGLLTRFGGQHWSIISRLQPVGEIVVLGMWCWCAWKPVRLAEYRRGLEKRVV